MLMNNCKNTTQSISLLLFAVYSIVYVPPSASLHFKLNAFLFRGMRVASRHRRMIPAAVVFFYEIYQEAKMHHRVFCTLFFFFLFSLRGSTYTLHQVSRKSTDACVPDLLSATLPESLYLPSSFFLCLFSRFFSP